jgi:hypothetical protein
LKVLIQHGEAIVRCERPGDIAFGQEGYLGDVHLVTGGKYDVIDYKALAAIELHKEFPAGLNAAGY